MKFQSASPDRIPFNWGEGVCFGALIVFLMLPLSSCKSSEEVTQPVAEDDDPVALTVGERKVRVSELQAEIDYLHRKQVSFAANREEFMERCLDRLVALEKAKELGLDQDIELRRLQ